MNEEEARAAVCAAVSRETAKLIEAYVDKLATAASAQNLIAASTRASIWSRHVLDSLQLLPLGPARGQWIDVGSGAGLPGLVVGLARPAPMLLVEPRRLRAQFLREMIEQFGLGGHVAVAASRVEAVAIGPAACISGRAVASLDRLLGMTHHLADERTRWLLPKGRSAAQEVAAAREKWQGDFQLVPSRTDPDARIVVARDVRARRGR